MEVPGTLSNAFPTLTPLPLSPELGWNESEWHMVHALLRLCDLRSALQLSLHMAPGVQRLLHRFAQTGSEHDSAESDQLRMELGVRSARLMQSLSARYHQPEHTNASRGTWYYEYPRQRRTMPEVLHGSEVSRLRDRQAAQALEEHPHRAAGSKWDRAAAMPVVGLSF